MSANVFGGRAAAPGRRAAIVRTIAPSASFGGASWANCTSRPVFVSTARRGISRSALADFGAPSPPYSLGSASWNTKRRSTFIPRRWPTMRGSPARTIWTRTPMASVISATSGPSRLLVGPSLVLSRRSAPLTSSTICGGS